jgi:hypothetical protein
MEKNVDVINVNGIEYIPKSKALDKGIVGDLKIVVLQRGWVMIGYLERNGSECKLHNASVIRNWGTTKGLGELAKEGKLANTKLDKCNGLVEFDYLTVVCSISCEVSKWEKEL